MMIIAEPTQADIQPRLMICEHPNEQKFPRDGQTKSILCFCRFASLPTLLGVIVLGSQWRRMLAAGSQKGGEIPTKLFVIIDKANEVDLIGGPGGQSLQLIRSRKLWACLII